MSFFENTRKPAGFGGKLMVVMMNLGHSPVAWWGLHFLELAPDDKVLDCGCGGGANIRRLLKKCPQGIVKGIDYSPVSVEKTKKVNETAIAKAPMMLADNYKPGFKIDLHIKDLTNAMNAGALFDAPLPLTEQMLEIMKKLSAGGDGSSDHSAVAKYYESLGGVNFSK